MEGLSHCQIHGPRRAWKRNPLLSLPSNLQSLLVPPRGARQQGILGNAVPRHLQWTERPQRMGSGPRVKAKQRELGSQSLRRLSSNPVPSISYSCHTCQCSANSFDSVLVLELRWGPEVSNPDYPTLAFPLVRQSGLTLLPKALVLRERIFQQGFLELVFDQCPYK